jgi:hypothetical protein
MIGSKELTPWTCHICSDLFEGTGGGRCRRCNHVVCSRHLKHIVIKGSPADKDGERLVCEECVREGEKTESPTTWIWKSWLFRRRN